MAETRETVILDAKVEGEQDVKNLTDSVKSSKEQIDKTSNSTANLSDSLDKATGGAISGFQGVIKGVKGATGGFKGLKGAIVATGIGALVVVVASLVEFFNNFEAGVRITTKAMNVLGGTVNAIVDNFSKLLQGDIIGFFKGVGDGAAQAAKDTDDLFDAEKRLFELQRDSIEQNAKLNAELRLKERAVRDTTLSTEERIKAQERINEISEKLIENEKAEIEEKLKKLKLEKSLDNNYKKEQDLTLAIEQAKASLIRTQGRLNESEDKGAQQVRRIREQEEKDEAAKEKKAKERAEKKAEDEQKAREKRQQLQEEQEKELEQLRISRITDEAEKLKRETDIEIEAIREKYGQGTELEAELIRNRDQRLAEIEQEELEKKEQAKLEILQRFEEQRLQAIEDNAIREKELQDLLNEDREFPDTIQGRRDEALEELEIEREKQIQKAIDLEASEEQLAQIKKRFADEKNDITEKANKAEADQEERLKLQKIQMAIDTIGSITSILGEQSKAAKGVAIAQALINTYQGISAGVALGFPAAIPAVAAATATGFKAVKDIVSTNVNTPATGSAAPSQTSTQAPQEPAFNLVGNAQTQGITQTQTIPEDNTTNVNVVTRPVTSGQEANRNAEQQSSF